MNISEQDIDRFEEKFTKSNECWEWQACLNDKGYGRFSFLGKPEKAHRISYQIYTGNIPEGLSVLHNCDNRKCVNPNHLFTGTQQDNIDDMHNKGRGNIGVKNGCSILNELEVVEIRNLYPYFNYREISAIYGVGKITIYDIIKRKTWKHVN